MTADLAAGRVVGIQPPGRAGTVREARLLPGALKELLTVAGPPVADLPPGTRLRLGAAVVVELTGAAPAAGDPGSAPGGLCEAGVAGVSPRRPAGVVAPGVVRLGDAIGIEAVVVPVEEALDLHPFRPDEVADVVAEYLVQAVAAGFASVRLIHGRGRGVQRDTVRRILAASPAVVAFDDAPPERGGWGATIVRLRGAGPPAR